MLPTMWVGVLSGVHLLFSVIIYILARLNLLKIKTHVIPVVFLLPLWGPLFAVILHIMEAADLIGTVEAGVEKLQVNEDAHRTLLVEDLNNERNVVPLQEALILNDPKLRRGMLLDVLYENSEDYHDLLHEAIDNEDGEVVHYATTAMAEISKAYEYSLQQYEKAYANDPENEKILREYCSFLGRYLDMNLMQGQMERMQRRQYAQLLEKSLAMNPSLHHAHLLAVTQIRLKDYAAANDTIDMMETRWPMEESTLLAHLELAVCQRNHQLVTKLLHRAEHEDIYISAEDQQKLRFFAGSADEPAERNTAYEAETI